MNARSGKRSRSATSVLTPALGSACSNCASAVRKSGVSHSSGASAAGSSTLATARSLGASGRGVAPEPGLRHVEAPVRGEILRRPHVAVAVPPDGLVDVVLADAVDLD